MRIRVSPISLTGFLVLAILMACEQKQKATKDVWSVEEGHTQLVIVAGQNVQCHSCYAVIGLLNKIQISCLDVVVISNETRKAEHEYFKRQFSSIKEHEVSYFFDNKLFDSLKTQYDFGGRLSYLVLGGDAELLYVDGGKEFDFAAFTQAISDNCQ